MSKGSGIGQASLRELEAFCAVLNLGKTTAAAALLGVSQPSISRALSSLQARTRRTLFRREGGRLQPTPYALTLKTKLDGLLSELSDIEEMSDKANLPDRLRLCCPSTLAEDFFAPAIAGFIVAHPSIMVSLEVGNVDAVMHEVAAGNADLGVTPRDSFEHKGMAVRTFQRSVGTVIMPAGHRLADQELIKASDLANEPLVTIPRHLPKHDVLDAIFRKHSVQPRVVASSNSVAVCAQLIRRGVGVGIHNPFPIALRYDDGLIFRSFSPKLEFKTSFVWRRRGSNLQTAEMFMDHIMDYTASVCGAHPLWQ